MLLVLGDPDIGFLVGRRLRSAGCVVVEAESAGEALESLGEEQRHSVPFDVVVADAVLETAPGLDLLAQIRALDWQRPVIMILARDSGLEALQRAWQLGAYAVFREPFDLDTLETAVLHAEPNVPGHA